MGSTVLIVDDDVTMAGMFGLMLEEEGFNVIVVHGADSAINSIRREKPSLVLLDVMMPGISGLDLCSHIRREPDLTDIPIVMVSAKQRAEDVESGINAGATVYLRKPVSMQDLLGGVRKALQSTGNARGHRK
jgi:DNA-binding response OmpR family regulator